MAILICYASKYGGTQEIAERIGGKLHELGHDVEVKSADAVVDVSGYSAFVIGSGVYSGAWLPEAADFVRRNSGTLSARPVWLFSSGPLGPKVASEHEQGPDVVLGQIRVFGSTHTIHWPVPKEVVEFRSVIKPREHEMFFGVLNHKKLPFVQSIAVRAVGGMEGDYRDWKAIDAWAESIARALTPAGAAPRSL